MDDLSRNDWENLMQYRKLYNREQQAKQALAMLDLQKDDPSYGFRINNYRHCLQSATMVMRDGGVKRRLSLPFFTTLASVSVRTTMENFQRPCWQITFQSSNTGCSGTMLHFLIIIHKRIHNSNGNEREQYRGHPYFEYTAEWVSTTTKPLFKHNMILLHLDFFEPMVYRIFTRPSKGIQLHLAP